MHTIGDLAGASRTFLVSRFGKMGDAIYDYVRGEDHSPVLSAADRATAKSVGNGMTFRRDLVAAEEIRIGIASLCEEIAARLRAAGRKATTVSLAIKDTLLQTLSRQRPLDKPTNLSRELADAAFALALDSWKMGRPIRALTVTAMNLIGEDEGGEQIGFFDAESDRRRERSTRLEGTLDQIRTRYGKAAISSGAILSSDFCVSPRPKDGKAPKKGAENEKNGE